MKPLYIILGIAALAIVAFLVFRKKDTTATDITGDTAAGTGSMFGDFAANFGKNTQQWILTSNANGWSNINTPLLKPGGISKQ